MSYPADYQRGGRKDGARNYVIYNEDNMRITDHLRFLKTANGEAYGFTIGGKIFIDPRIATAETPIHEYAHLWAEALRKGNPKEWKNVVELMKDTPIWEEIKKRYPELKTDDEIADEVLATYSGRRGAERLRAEQAKVARSSDDLVTKAKKISVLERVKQALNKFWKSVADFLHIHYTSAEDVADRVMRDLLEGVNPNERLEVKRHKEAQNERIQETNPMLDDYHTGIREEGDILTLGEAVEEARREAEDGGWNSISSYPDVDNEVYERALERGEITVYSSHPIEDGAFVSPSRMQAEDYAGGGKVYSKTVPVEDVAWINADEGQYAGAKAERKVEGSTDVRFSKADEEREIEEHEPGTEYGASPEGDIRFREVEDDAVLREFAEGKTVTAYRTMQVIDGKLYSPMATKVGKEGTPEIKLGVPEQAEEHPESIKRTKIGRDGVEQGYVVIDKGLGKGTLPVAYNPYLHTSRSALNDQFTGAYRRPNLVTVEVEVPESELTSGYRAAMAKNAVGEVAWHSGSVSGQLSQLGKPRRVILTRYDRPVRVVPFREVAQMIARQLEGTDIEIPYNVVQPQLREELMRLGVKISDVPSGNVVDRGDIFGKAEYVTDEAIEDINGRAAEDARTAEAEKRSYVEKMSQEFNTPVRVVEDVNELTHGDATTERRMRRSKGWYDTKTGEVVVVWSPDVFLVENANKYVPLWQFTLKYLKLKSNSSSFNT